MARTPKAKTTTHQSSKTAHSKAAAKFTNEKENETICLEYQNEPKKLDFGSTSIVSLQDHQAKKKVSTRETGFQMQKKASFAAARKNSKDVAQAGAAYIGDIKDKIRELKNEERPSDKYLKDFERFLGPQEASFGSLSTMYPTILGDLAPRRSNQVNAASAMIKGNPVRRQIALKSFSKNARTRVEEVRENEKIATDASRLIKHYKNLLNA